jgi:hypothetical protein
MRKYVLLIPPDVLGRVDLEIGEGIDGCRSDCLMCVVGQSSGSRPANNPLHRALRAPGESQGRAMSIPSAMSVHLACFGAVVRQPVSRERWPARGNGSAQQRRLVRRSGGTKGAGWPLERGVSGRVVCRALGDGAKATAGSAHD